MSKNSLAKYYKKTTKGHKERNFKDVKIFRNEKKKERVSMVGNNMKILKEMEIRIRTPFIRSSWLSTISKKIREKAKKKRNKLKDKQNPKTVIKANVI